MTGGIGTVHDNTSREQTNRDNSDRIRYLQDRIRKAYSNKTAHLVPEPECDTPEARKAKERVIQGIRITARQEHIRNRSILVIFCVVAVLLALGFFLLIT
ncbi:MAG: hypothetical protein U0T82_11505 [Bacteroidales bacterium]